MHTLSASGGNATSVSAMARSTSGTADRSGDSRTKAVLGPTNTGKTHQAIERLCAHTSGAIGFPLRLLAREVYDKVSRPGLCRA